MSISGSGYTRSLRISKIVLINARAPMKQWREHMLLPVRKRGQKYIELAETARNQIKEKGDRDYFFSELETINC